MRTAKYNARCGKQIVSFVQEHSRGGLLKDQPHGVRRDWAGIIMFHSWGLFFYYYYYHYYWYYYYSIVAISTFVHICLGTKLEREIKQQQKSCDLGENRKGNVHPWSRACGVLKVLRLLLSWLLSAGLKNQRKLQNSCRKILFDIYWNYYFWKCDLVPSARAPSPGREGSSKSVQTQDMEGWNLSPCSTGLFFSVYNTELDFDREAACCWKIISSFAQLQGKGAKPKPGCPSQFLF